MNGSSLVTIIVALIGAAAGSGMWTWIANRHKPPIERAEADQAEKNAAVDNSLAVAKGARDLAESLRTEVTRQGEEIDALRGEVTSLRTRYCAALDVIRELTQWVTHHTPDDAEGLPVIPDVITDDL